MVIMQSDIIYTDFGELKCTVKTSQFLRIITNLTMYKLVHNFTVPVLWRHFVYITTSNKL